MYFIYETQGIYFIFLCASVICVITIHNFFKKEKIKILKYELKYEDYTDKFECHFFRFCLFLKVVFYFFIILFALSYSLLGNSLIVINYFKNIIIFYFKTDFLTLFVYSYTYMRYLKIIYYFLELRYDPMLIILGLIFSPLILAVINQS